MLFNSYQFIFLYLPIVFFGFFWIARSSYRLAALWLAVASIFFYGYWNPKFVSLLFASIVFNYGAGYWIGYARLKGKSKPILTAAIIANLLLLCIFKYANFFIATVNIVNAQIGLLDIVLPLGISFFTFTQIAFLVDAHRGVAREYNFIHYLLFVTWFPHLIAGPVLHHKQMMPQFSLPETYRPNAESIAVGLTLFSLGLFKKVVLADQFALYANPVFNAVADGGQPMLFEAWIGALAYTLQLYFDFSGYSDMAIGLSRLFNIKLPLNFNSPYKASSVIDFWRRWHMTLSAFLRDYLYFSLGGNRKGTVRRHLNLMVTMLLGGLWHGAGWNFVLWGGLHGIYLVINHGWQKLACGLRLSSGRLIQVLSVLLTFTCVVIAWVPFRSANFGVTQAMLSGMTGLNGVSISPRFAYLGELSHLFTITGWLPLTGMLILDVVLWLTAGFLIVWALPNTQQWLANFSPAWDNVISLSRLAWKPTRLKAIMVGMLLGFSLLCLNRVSEFLYFQF
jgi:alginate O-acetyltransferase complex protein AlgI